MLKITGNLRSVANSAWISTMRESRADSRSEEEVLRVTNYLVREHHTSPFECITLTFDTEGDESLRHELERCLQNAGGEYVRSTFEYDKLKLFSVDLLNYVKISEVGTKMPLSWAELKKIDPELTKVVSQFSKLEGAPSDDVRSLIGSHNMQVEVVSKHLVRHPDHDRVTWRIRTPLSIAVQMVRHRKGSYNMLSGRYKTIFQRMYHAPDDCNEIFEKIGMSQSEYFASTDLVLDLYRSMMSKAKETKNLGKITNDEYKRFREVARFILPEGRMTELYVTYYLSDYYNSYSKLRNSKHAQTEHIWLAQEMQRALDKALGLD